MLMDGRARWLDHSAMTDLGRYGDLVDRLPETVGALSQIVQGVLIHRDCLEWHGLRSDAVERPRETLPAGECLREVFDADDSDLVVSRPPAKRLAGTCRDFALLTCALLRAKHIPARLRCGFAAYLGEGWEDHWLCEYWNSSTAGWIRVDAQLDATSRERLHIAFDPTDVPPDAFVTAGEAWRTCRREPSRATRFGQGSTTGLWFIGVDVVRDHYALHNRETSPFDRWRMAAEGRRVLKSEDLPLLDDLALHPDGPLHEMEPAWLI
jgi:hypothetical protein